MLTDVLTPAARKIAYTAYAVAVFLLGAIQVGYSAGGYGQPVWLTVALSVAAFVGTAIGATAAANVPATGAKAPGDLDAGYAAYARLPRDVAEDWNSPEDAVYDPPGRHEA